MGGYSKIDKNKIQPSPSLAFLNGILGGLNIRKKEMQDKEDKQNKADMELGKWIKEFGLKERETQVKERGATVEEEKVQQAYLTIEDTVNQTTIRLKQLLFDMDKYAKDPALKERLESYKYNLDVMKEGILQSNRDKLEERKNKLLVAGQIAVEIKRQAGDIATQTMIQAGQNKRNAEDNARMTEVANLNNDNDLVIAKIRSQESAGGVNPKLKAYNDRLANYESDMKTTFTSSSSVVNNQILKMFESRRSTLEQEANILRKDATISGNIIMPTNVAITKEGKPRGWFVKTLNVIPFVDIKDAPPEFELGGTSTTTQPLSVSPAIQKRIDAISSNIGSINLMAKKAGKTTRQYLIDNHEPLQAINAVLGE